MALSISKIVDVSSQITPVGVTRRDFGRALLLTDDTPKSGRTVGRVSIYSSPDSLAEDWDSTSRPGQAANIYFRQVPFPKPLLIGQWNRTSTDSLYTGTGGYDNAAAVALAATGTLIFLGETVTVGDLTGVSNVGEAAPIVQTALRTNPAITAYSPTVTVTTTDLVITFTPASGQALSLPAGTVFTGTAAVALGLDSGDLTQGTSAETLEDVMAAIRAVEAGFYFVGLDSGMADTQAADDLVAWTEVRNFMAFLDTSGRDALLVGDQTSRSAILSATDATRTFAVWNETLDEYKSLSLAAKMSTIDFSAPNSYQTAKFTQLFGTTPSEITETEADELSRKNINYSTRYGPVPILAEGTTLTDQGFIDLYYWLDWFVNAIESDVFNSFIRRRVPQTAPGVNQLADVAKRVCEEGVGNGGIAPGRLSEELAADVRAITGDTAFDGNLTRGYLIHAVSIDSQSLSDRAQRKSPAVFCWLKSAGALHFADFNVILER